MSFTGAINAETRRWLGNVAKVFTDKKIVIGCSGNFTCEQIITRYSEPSHIWGNDVSLYTSALGAFLTGDEFYLDIRDERICFVRDCVQSTEDRAATILLLSEALGYEKEKNPYQTRMWNHYRNNFGSLHKKTIEKLHRYKENIRLDRYTSKDIGDLLKEIPPDSAVIAFLPTYAGGYEKLYKRMEELFLWDKPRYELIDDERKMDIIGSLRSFQYLYIDDTRIEDMPVAAVIEKRGFRSVYIYSNMEFGKKAFIRNKTGFERSSFERLNDSHEITEKSRLLIKPTTNNIINYFRNLYLKKGIEYVNGDTCFLVFVDKKLFGFLIFSLNRFNTSDIYLLSDFVITISRYKRLSKLLLLVSLSDRIREHLERKYLKKISTILTTVFTDKPVSMKYRGIYKLHSRKENRLNYIGEAGAIKLEEVIPLWLKKYEKKKA